MVESENAYLVFSHSFNKLRYFCYAKRKYAVGERSVKTHSMQQVDISYISIT